MEEDSLHLHRLAWVLLPYPQLMLHEKAILVTQFADHLPRGHDLSALLGPSSPDVLDPVWNTHARNPGKQQPFQKGNSDLVVRWEPSIGRHLPSQGTFLTSHRGLKVRFLGDTLLQWDYLWQS